MKAGQEEDECKQPVRWAAEPSAGSVVEDRPLAGRTEELLPAAAEQDTTRVQHIGPASDPPTVAEHNSITDGRAAVVAVAAGERIAHKAGQQLLLVGTGYKFVAAAVVAAGRQAIRPERNTGQALQLVAADRAVVVVVAAVID